MKEKNSNNDIRISVEFLESGKLLGDSSSEIHRYELDLDVPQDITCDAFLGALCVGIRSILTERYQLDVLDNQSTIQYQDLLDQMGVREFDPQRGNLFLRFRGLRDLRLRAASLRYAAARRSLYMMDDITARHTAKIQDPKTRERICWQVCWRIFLECFYAYCVGYPEESKVINAQMLLSEQYRCHPAILRSTVYAEPAKATLMMISQAECGSRTLRDLGFVSGSRLVFDPVLWHQSAVLFEGAALKNQIATDQKTHQLMPGGAEPYLIPTPGKMPERGRMDLPMVVLPSVFLMLTVFAVWIITGLSADPMTLWMLSAAMVIGTLLSACVNRKLMSRNYDIQVQSWRLGYEQSIRRCLQELKSEQKDDIRIMEWAYPPARSHNDRDLLHKAVSTTAAIQDRRPGGADFLKVRLGRSVEGSRLVPFSRPICLAHTEEDLHSIRFRNLLDSGAARFTLELPGSSVPNIPGNENHQGSMNELGLKLNTLYGYLEDAPVTLELEKLRALGLVSLDGLDLMPFITNLILDLCCRQRPEDLQMVILFPPTSDRQEQNDQIHRFKSLPHFRGLFHDRAAFAFSKEDAWQIYDRLHRIGLDRETSAEHHLHVMVVMLHDYEFQSHALSCWMEERYRRSESGDGMTLIFCKNTRYDLPVYCSTMIRADSEHRWYLVPISHLNRADITGEFVPFHHYCFQPDPGAGAKADLSRNRDTEPYYLAFRSLSARYYGVEKHPLPPTYLELFRLVRNPSTGKSAGDVADAAGAKQDKELANLLQRHLKEVIARNWENACCHDLQVPIGKGAEEDICLDLRESGHLLIAGDSGSGKTCAALTLLLQLCIRFNPDELKISLVDMSGHELLKSLHGLPHILHALSLDSQNIQTVRTEMRALIDALQKQNHQRRMALLAENCRTIDEYNQKSGKVMEHQFLVIDNYDLLCGTLHGSMLETDRMDLNSELVKLIQEAEGTGLHLILLSKYPEHSLSDALWTCIQSRLCLKTSDGGLSHRMIGTEAAADIQIPGRAYLIHRNSTLPVQVQIAYAGGDIAAKKNAPFRLMLAEPGGALVPFFDSATYASSNDSEEIVFYTTYDPDCGTNVDQLRRYRAAKKSSFDAWRGMKSDPDPQGRTGDTETQTRQPDGTADPRPEWWYARKAVLGGRFSHEPQPDPGVPIGNADPRPEWWYAQKEAQGGQSGHESQSDSGVTTGNADPRPEWWYARKAAQDGQSGHEPQPDPGVPIGNADPRPEWWYARKTAQDGQSGHEPQPDPGVTTGNADPRPEWWYAKKERRKKTVHNAYSDDHTWEKKTPDYQGKRYTLNSNGPSIDKHRKRNEDRTKRYFRPPVAVKEPRRVILPRPDQTICERRPIGVTQAQCLAEMLRTNRPVAVQEPVSVT